MKNEIEDDAVERKYCVYIHTNKINDKKYVGQTGRDPEVRWGANGNRYLTKKDGKFTHPAFAPAIIKYGWDNFDHEIIASNLSKDEADNLEKLLIEELDTMNHKYGYNCKEGGSRGRLSDESKKKISDAQETCSVEQYNLNGELIKIWDSITSVEEELKIHCSNIINCCKGIRNTAGGYIWRYHDKDCSEYNLIEITESIKEDIDARTKKRQSDARKGTHLSEETKRKIGEANSGEKHWNYGKHPSEETIRKFRESRIGKAVSTDNHNARMVSQYDKQGNLVKVWGCMKDASRDLKIDYRNIYRCCKGERKTAGDFIWRYYEDELIEEYLNWCNEKSGCGRWGKYGTPIAQYSLSGELICVFNGISEAVLKTGVYRNGIYRCCNGERNKAGGFKWKYYDDIEEVA